METHWVESLRGRIMVRRVEVPPDAVAVGVQIPSDPALGVLGVSLVPEVYVRLRALSSEVRSLVVAEVQVHDGHQEGGGSAG